METVSAILDAAQDYLHDDGTLWPRTELLGYLNHGYSRLLAETAAIRRLAAHEVPARVFWSLTHPWERQHVSRRQRTWALNAEVKAGYRCTFRWEAEHLQGAVPTDSPQNCTQFWERLYAGTVEHNDRYPYPDNHAGTCRIVYNTCRLLPTTVRELDDYAANWMQTSGGPFWYTAGLGSDAEFEVWPQVSTYSQAVELRFFLGTIRQAGTYTVTAGGTGSAIDGRSLVTRGLAALGAWGKRLVTRGLLGLSITTTRTPTDTAYPSGALGIPRGFAGDVQYIVEALDRPGSPVVGVPRRWTGSTNALLLDYAVTAPTLTEADTPDLLPAPFAKYLRYAVLARALAREGEGTNTVLATHYAQRFAAGVALLHRIGFMAETARTYQNQKPVARSQRPLRPRLPASYPRVR